MVAAASGGGSRRRRGRKPAGPKPPPRTMRRVPSGVPEVAQVHPEQYEELLTGKVGMLASLLKTATGEETLPEVEIFESERDHFRMRAAFATWREGPEVHYVMFNAGTREPVQTLHFPMGSKLINELMPVVREAIETTPVLNDKINDVRFLTTTTGEALVSITYNRPINDTCAWPIACTHAMASSLPRAPPRRLGRLTSFALGSVSGRWVQAATALQGSLTAVASSMALGGGGDARADTCVRIVGRSRKVQLAAHGHACVHSTLIPRTHRCTSQVKLVIGGETVQERLRVPGRGECVYTQTEGAFTQPNARVCEAMLGWAYDVTRGSEDADLCELYCGNGCFTVALAPNFRRVVATEVPSAPTLPRSHVPTLPRSHAPTCPCLCSCMRPFAGLQGVRCTGRVEPSCQWHRQHARGSCVGRGFRRSLRGHTHL